MSAMTTCYNKGCGKQFDASDNSTDACVHHPGFPVFHDALKGWSCCDKKSTDFTQFLSYPGCTRAPHSAVRAPEAPKPAVEVQLAPVRAPLEKVAATLAPRPAHSPLAELPRTVAPALGAALAARSAQTAANVSDGQSLEDAPCLRAACKARYPSREPCVHHPGVAVFHEGMKYWSCCQRKTSEFDSFLEQLGCVEGEQHLWRKDETQEEDASCRFDFHQTGGFYIVTFYAKLALPERCSVRASAISLQLELCFEAGAKCFRKQCELFGVINTDESVVNFFATKVEIKLKKADAVNWPRLEQKQ